MDRDYLVSVYKLSKILSRKCQLQGMRSPKIRSLLE